MTPTAVALALVALLIGGLAFGAMLLNVPPLWIAILVVLAVAGTLAIASARSRRRAPTIPPRTERPHY